MPLPHHGINEEVRVCDGCYIKLANAKATKNNGSSANKNMQHIEIDYDDNDDLKKVIALSLKEEEQRKKAYGTGYVSRENLHGTPGVTVSSTYFERKANFVQSTATGVNEHDPTDADLVAAIAASLREIEISAPPPTTGYELKHDKLSVMEVENIELFSGLINQGLTHGDDIVNNTQIRDLYPLIGDLQPKLSRTLDETVRKYSKKVYDLCF